MFLRYFAINILSPDKWNVFRSKCLPVRMASTSKSGLTRNSLMSYIVVHILLLRMVNKICVALSLETTDCGPHQRFRFQ